MLLQKNYEQQLICLQVLSFELLIFEVVDEQNIKIL
jgi:hypothetical protein